MLSDPFPKCQTAQRAVRTLLNLASRRQFWAIYGPPAYSPDQDEQLVLPAGRIGTCLAVDDTLGSLFVKSGRDGLRRGERLDRDIESDAAAPTTPTDDWHPPWTICRGVTRPSDSLLAPISAPQSGQDPDVE